MNTADTWKSLVCCLLAGIAFAGGSSGGDDKKIATPEMLLEDEGISADRDVLMSVAATNEHPLLRGLALRVLGEKKWTDSGYFLRIATNDAAPSVRIVAAKLLASNDLATAVNILSNELAVAKNDSMKVQLVEYLGDCGSDAGYPALKELLRSSSFIHRRIAVRLSPMYERGHKEELSALLLDLLQEAVIRVENGGKGKDIDAHEVKVIYTSLSKMPSADLASKIEAIAKKMTQADSELLLKTASGMKSSDAKSP